MRLAIAIMSYNGNLDYGLLGDYDAMPTSTSSPTGSSGRWRRCWRPHVAVARRPPRPSGRESDTGPGAATPAATAAAAPPTPATPATRDHPDDRGRPRRPGDPATPAPITPAPIVPRDRSRTRGPAADMRAKREQAPQRSRSQPRKP